MEKERSPLLWTQEDCRKEPSEGYKENLVLLFGFESRGWGRRGGQNDMLTADWGSLGAHKAGGGGLTFRFARRRQK